MIIQNKKYKLVFNDANGSLESLDNGKKEFILEGAVKRPLFTLRFRDEKGVELDLHAHQAQHMKVLKESSGDTTIIKMEYKDIGNLPVNIHVKVSCPADEAMTYWSFSVEHDTDYCLEWVDFPDIVIPNDLVAAGGDARLLWPVGEGVLIEDADLREKSWLMCKPLGYPSKGWGGYYPGSAQTQFMAYYDKNGGLYIGAHDDECNIKILEFYKQDGGIRLEHRVFAEAAVRGRYETGYNLVLGVFEGDWYDAADIYRSFYKNSKIPKPPRFCENDKLPQWMKESPVVVTYPVRGQMHLGDMTPNSDFYPYTNALPIMNRLSEDFDSKVMALLMQWEGTAPWAPPYVWPPFGGEENFRQFVESLHNNGNLAGVYCSGIAWTDESLLVPEYNRKKEFEEKKLARYMCVSPEGRLDNSLICNGDIRWGYDVCVDTEFAEEAVVGEVGSIISSGCDYIQYFDQMHGGAPNFCYSREHGHPSAPGKWMKESIIKIYEKLHKIIGESGNKVVLGCESAVAEPYMQYLMLNDVRFEINMFYGKPVPLYAYLYHEYINNFMGNQNGSSDNIDVEKSPCSLLQRISYSFTAGDMFTVVLRDGGDINWDWCCKWNVTKPEQEPVLALIKNLNAWRRNIAKPYLCFGQMLKPYGLKGTYDIPMIYKDGRTVPQPSLFTSRWRSPEGCEAQIVVNYTGKKQSASMRLAGLKGKEITVFTRSDGQESYNRVLDNEELMLEIEAFSAVMVKL